MNNSMCGFTACCIAGILLGMAGPSSPAVLAAGADDRCIAVQAAYEVGSSTTKVKVARVDLCGREIIEVLLDITEPVAYQEDPAGSDGGVLSEATGALRRADHACASIISTAISQRLVC